MNPARRGEARSSTELYDQPRRVTRIAHIKKEGIDLKTIRHVNIRLVLETEAGPIDLVDVVSPTDETGHP
jgi:hypothetical protein